MSRVVSGNATPTCVQFVQCDSNQAVASYSDGKIALIDLDSGKVVTSLTEEDGE